MVSQTRGSLTVSPDRCDLRIVHCTEDNWFTLWQKHVQGASALYIQSYERIDASVLAMVGEFFPTDGTLISLTSRIRHRDWHYGMKRRCSDPQLLGFADKTPPC